MLKFNIPNMGGVGNATSTHKAEKTPAGKSYGKSVKLFGSQLKKNAREALKGFDAEKLRSRFEKFCSTTGPQAKKCASDLCKQAESHLRKGAKEAHKQWKTAKPHLEQAMHSTKKFAIDLGKQTGSHLQKGAQEAHKQWKTAKPHLEQAMHSIQKNYGTLKNKVEGQIDKKLGEWAQKRGYKRDQENYQSYQTYQSEEKWAGLSNPDADARNEVPEFHRGGSAKVNTSVSQHTAESESPHWDFSKIAKSNPTLLKTAKDLYATFNRAIGPDDDYGQIMDEKNEAKEALNTLFKERDVLEKTAKRFE